MKELRNDPELAGVTNVSQQQGSIADVCWLDADT
jgi:hypothetical protein